MSRAARWAKNGAQPTVDEEHDAEADRQAHITTVAEALAAAWHEPLDWVRPDAVIAVDALLADGVVLTRFGNAPSTGGTDE